MSQLQPTVIILILILMTLIIASSMNFMMKTAWLTYIIILMMVGAMLILFMYMASLIPNNPNPPLKIVLPLMIVTSLIFIPKTSSFSNLMISTSNFPLNTTMSSFSVFYLFLLLFMMMMIIKNPKTPLRSNYAK